MLIVIVDGEKIENPAWKFKSIYSCNRFARAIESGDLAYSFRMARFQNKITAYCIPKQVLVSRENPEFQD
jgi:hypothetical protein